MFNGIMFILLSADTQQTSFCIQQSLFLVSPVIIGQGDVLFMGGAGYQK
jgi:hypothetical protein